MPAVKPPRPADNLEAGGLHGLAPLGFAKSLRSNIPPDGSSRITRPIALVVVLSSRLALRSKPGGNYAEFIALYGNFCLRIPCAFYRRKRAGT
jgi:hypothetical protein